MNLPVHKFKKVKEDKHSTTLEHPDGHKIVIAHSKLSDKMRKDLAKLPTAMAEGGMVDEAGGEAPTAPPATQAPVVVNVQAPQAAAPQGYMGPTGSPSIAPPPTAGVSESTPAVMASPNPQPNEAPPSEPVQPETSSRGLAAVAPGAPQAAAQGSDPYGSEAYLSTYQRGMNEARAGTLGEATAIGNEGKAEQALLQQSADIQQKAAADYQAHYKELEQERQHFVDDIRDGHIDPNHYMKSLGTGGQIASAIGLILGGIGAGLTGKENMASAFIDQQIGRDIEAQKANLGKQENLLSANLKQFGNMRDAVEMTRLQQSAIVTDKLRAAAATAKDPIAKARALQAIGDRDKADAPVLSQIAMRRTMSSNGLSGGSKDNGTMGQTIQALRTVNPAMAKSVEERYIPGVGLATVPIPNETRNTIIAKQQLNNMTADFYKWAQANSGSLNPATVNEGKTKAAELQSLYRNAINGGVFKKGEQDFIDQIVDSDPTKFFNNVRVLPKLREVISSNNAQLDTLKKGFGLPVDRFQVSAPVPNKK